LHPPELSPRGSADGKSMTDSLDDIGCVLDLWFYMNFGIVILQLLYITGMPSGHWWYCDMKVLYMVSMPAGH
jgi:hypothetical protein